MSDGGYHTFTCEACRDTKWITVVDGEGVERTQRCDCWRAAVAAAALAAAHIPERFSRANLDSYVGATDSQSDALRATRRFVDVFPAKQRGLLLYGPPGTGKTHLAAAALMACLRKAGRGKFFHVTELLRALRDTYQPATEETEASIMTSVFECDLLVLDELGAEKTSPWTQETLGLVMNTFYNSGKPVIITTNLVDAPDITDPNALLCKIGARSRSRLREMCEWVEVDGVDARVHGAPTPPRAIPPGRPAAAPARPPDFQLSPLQPAPGPSGPSRGQPRHRR